jgi:hypothetical protein
MFTSDECRQRGNEKLAQAALDKSHSIRLTTAGQAWHHLASKIDAESARTKRKTPLAE